MSENEIPDWLMSKTFVIQYCPNCPSTFLVRLPGKHPIIDMEPATITNDAIGLGTNLLAAAYAAKIAQDRIKPLRKTTRK